MNYIDFEVGNKTYKLRLNTKNIILMERTLGRNPVMIFGLDPENPSIPSITEMVAILHAALQQYNHGISMNDAYDIFDEYMEEHAATDFISVIMSLFQQCGIMPTNEEVSEEEKNA